MCVYVCTQGSAFVSCLPPFETDEGSQIVLALALFFLVCVCARLCVEGIVFRASSVPDGQSCQVLIVSALCASVLSHFNLL